MTSPEQAPDMNLGGVDDPSVDPISDAGRISIEQGSDGRVTIKHPQEPPVTIPKEDVSGWFTEHTRRDRDKLPKNRE